MSELTFLFSTLSCLLFWRYLLFWLALTSTSVFYFCQLFFFKIQICAKPGVMRQGGVICDTPPPQ